MLQTVFLPHRVEPLPISLKGEKKKREKDLVNNTSDRKSGGFCLRLYFLFAPHMHKQADGGLRAYVHCCILGFF